MLGDVSEYQQERKGFWHEASGTATSEAIALETWARAAHPILEETAASYHAVAREGAFAERLQQETGIRTTRAPDKWLAKLLVPLATLHAREGYPVLTALVVDAQGRVGERFEELLRAAEEPPAGDASTRESRAATARLGCYQWAGSAPDDGGVPDTVYRTTRAARTPRASSGGGSASTRAPRAPRAPREPKPAAPKRVAASDRPVNVCPTCFMAIPATGLCDNCD